MKIHENRLPVDDSHEFIIFEEDAKIVCCKLSVALDMLTQFALFFFVCSPSLARDGDIR